MFKKLTETVNYGFYRLLDGEHAGRVVIKSNARIEDKYILFFANDMVWIYADDLKNIRCEMAFPKFNKARHEIDRSKAHWYTDGGTYQEYDW
jgi:hypothetical protein